MTNDEWKAECEQREKPISDRLASMGVDYPSCGFYVGDGWKDVVFATLQQLIEMGWDRKLGQVKSKFCTLRIYLDGECNESMEEVIHAAERICAGRCEDCGAPHGLDVPRSGVAVCKSCRSKP